MKKFIFFITAILSLSLFGAGFKNYEIGPGPRPWPVLS
jgi:hypothetical protein